MILCVCNDYRLGYCVLHVCGDDPIFQTNLLKVLQCSPRMWRWSYLFLWYLVLFEVFSTYVEMILCSVIILFKDSCVLHVCGDDPNLLPCFWRVTSCSPRMWRWSYIINVGLDKAYSVLHVCGDDPEDSALSVDVDSCSPRMWRWSPDLVLSSTGSTVFSTYVEMIPPIADIAAPATGVLPVSYTHLRAHET